MQGLIKKYGDERRTAIEQQEIGDVNQDDLVTEETMVVTLSQRGYIKRTSLTVYQAQNRGGKGIKGAKTGRGASFVCLLVTGFAFVGPFVCLLACLPACLCLPVRASVSACLPVGLPLYLPASLPACLPSEIRMRNIGSRGTSKRHKLR